MSLATSPAPSHSTAATFGPGTTGAGTHLAAPAPAGAVPGASPLTRSISGMSATSRKAPSTVGPMASSEPPHVIEGPGGRFLCVADVRGNLSSLNTLAAEVNAQAIIHTGDFGFYEKASFERISDRTLRHLVQYSTSIAPTLRNKLLTADPMRGGVATSAAAMRAMLQASPTDVLSELPALLTGELKFNVPVYAVWGACEDVAVLERFRTGEYAVHNLHVLDEASSYAIEVGGVRLRLFGLGGAVVLHKLFDNGDGAATIAGGQGTMWTTVLQIGELVDTAQKCYDPTETRVLITHASPGREGLLAQLALALKADLTISAGLHFRYGVSYNEFSVQHDAENYRNKLLNAKTAFGEVWEAVRAQVTEVIDDSQRVLLNHALAVTNRVPPLATATGAANEEPAWKNTWNWNLPDAAYGSLVLDVKDGRVSAETKSQGFNFAYRRSNMPMSAATPIAAGPATPAKPFGAAGNAGLTTSGLSPTPSQQQPPASSPRGNNAAPAKASSPNAAAGTSPKPGNTPAKQQQQQHARNASATASANGNGAPAAASNNDHAHSPSDSKRGSNAGSAAANGNGNGNGNGAPKSRRSKSNASSLGGGAKSDAEGTAASKSDGETWTAGAGAGSKSEGEEGAANSGPGGNGGKKTKRGGKNKRGGGGGAAAAAGGAQSAKPQPSPAKAA